MYLGSKSRGRVEFGDQHFGDVPLRFSGFWRFLMQNLGSADVWVGLGSAFRGWVGFRDQTFGDAPLGFRGLEYITMHKMGTKTFENLLK